MLELSCSFCVVPFPFFFFFVFSICRLFTSFTYFYAVHVLLEIHHSSSFRFILLFQVPPDASHLSLQLFLLFSYVFSLNLVHVKFCTWQGGVELGSGKWEWQWQWHSEVGVGLGLVYIYPTYYIYPISVLESSRVGSVRVESMSTIYPPITCVRDYRGR